ncbi:GNAT family N-acetyltransferase [Clostridium sp.]|uniref:GNAT family N-acetyltransferase n=1 Tax=Clostridium sp. TaxID=1506 RepID=UPI002845F0EB|nr:GNAT family N-acetyltransferase [Clostridium sp.]MDR3594337.1 GNAT family N-acetyltransferase [Clostridium sp.]
MISDFEFTYNLSECQMIDLLDIYKEESWSKNREIDDVRKMIEKSWIIAIIDSNNGKIIAFARVLSDFVYRAFIYDVIVSKNYRGLKFGKLIINSIINHRDFKNVERIELNCIDDKVLFYKKLGFDKVPNGTNMMRYCGN